MPEKPMEGQRRPRRPHHRPTHPPPNRPTAAPPAMPGRCCSPASMKCSHSCVRPVAARCASSPSSPTPPPCAPSSPLSVCPRHHHQSHPPAARHGGRRPMLSRIRHPIRRSSPPRPTSSISASPGNQVVMRRLQARRGRKSCPPPLTVPVVVTLSSLTPRATPSPAPPPQGCPRHRRSTRPTQPPMGGVMWLNRLSFRHSIHRDFL